MKVVIADAGPLIGLARIDQLVLLTGLFGKIWITEVIAAEIGLRPAAAGTPTYPGMELLQGAFEQGWLQIAPALVQGIDPYRPLPGVDAGEASAIGLALSQQAAGESVLLVVDDRCGRAEAQNQGLVIIGTAAVLVLAKERGLVKVCSPLLVALRDQGYYLSDALVVAVLKQAQED